MMQGSATRFRSASSIDGFFHQWGVDVVEAAEGFGTFSVAIVELMDGTIITPAAELIQFMSPEEKQ